MSRSESTKKIIDSIAHKMPDEKLRAVYKELSIGRQNGSYYRSLYRSLIPTLSDFENELQTGYCRFDYELTDIELAVLYEIAERFFQCDFYMKG